MTTLLALGMILLCTEAATDWSYANHSGYACYSCADSPSHPSTST